MAWAGDGARWPRRRFGTPERTREHRGACPDSAPRGVGQRRPRTRRTSWRGAHVKRPAPWPVWGRFAAQGRSGARSRARGGSGPPQGAQPPAGRSGSHHPDRRERHTIEDLMRDTGPCTRQVSDWVSNWSGRVRHHGPDRTADHVDCQSVGASDAGLPHRATTPTRRSRTIAGRRSLLFCNNAPRPAPAGRGVVRRGRAPAPGG